VKKLIALSIASVVLGCASAYAADYPTKAPIYNAPAFYNWSGCYFGGNAGGIWGTSNINIPAYPSNFDIDMSSFIGGAQLGCNYAFAGNLIIGIEGDWSWIDLAGNRLSGGAGAERYGVAWDSIATLRGRFGFAFGPEGRWFLYGTGGGAWANLDQGNFIPGLVVTVPQSGTHAGWVAGFGIEWALPYFGPNIVVGLEYLHAEFDTRRYMYVGPVDVNLNTDTVRARLSVKFP
jgi:outer membrane immunogenic protein